jgi:hypothetical protein
MTYRSRFIPSVQGLNKVGSTWRSGLGPPAAALGARTDWYIDTITGEFYEKTGHTTWTVRTAGALLKTGGTMTGDLTVPRVVLTGGGGIQHVGGYAYFLDGGGGGAFIAGGAGVPENYYRNDIHIFSPRDASVNWVIIDEEGLDSSKPVQAVLTPDDPYNFLKGLRSHLRGPSIGNHGLVPYPVGSSSGEMLNYNEMIIVGEAANANHPNAYVNGLCVQMYSGGPNKEGSRAAGFFELRVAAAPRLGGVVTLTLTNGGSGYVNGDWANVALTGGSGTGAVAQVGVAGGAVYTANMVVTGSGYAVGDVLSASNTYLGGSGSGLQFTVASITAYADDVGLHGSCHSYANVGGTPADPRGTVFAGSFQASLQSGATEYFAVVGAEVGMQIMPGASAANRVGWDVVSNTDTRASGMDCAYSVRTNTAVGWKTGICFNKFGFAHGSAHIADTLIGDDNSGPFTATNFAQFPNWTISGNILKFPNLEITGAGKAHFSGSSAAFAGACAMSLKYAGGATENGLVIRPDADTSTAVLFKNAAGTIIGSVTTAAAATAFNTTSDGRLKEDLRPIDSGAMVDAIEPYNFRWKGSKERGYGVIAQDVAEVMPQACHHNQVDDQWAVDYSKLVPVLLAEIKALRARMAEIEGGTASTPRGKKRRGK